MPIDTIIFDFGNVIAYFDYKIAAGRIGRTIGLNGSELMSKAMTLEFQPLLMDLESGRIDEIAFLTELKQRLQLPQPVDEIAADWADIFTANQPVHDLAHAAEGPRISPGARLQYQRHSCPPVSKSVFRSFEPV